MDELTIAAIGGAIGIIAATIVMHEWKGWSPRLRAGVICFAAARLHEELRDRMRDEWTAHVDEMPSEISRWWTAIGFILASVRLEPPRVEFKIERENILRAKGETYEFSLLVVRQMFRIAESVTPRPLLPIRDLIDVILDTAGRAVKTKPELDSDEKL